uniref:Uncharacterized protein n=1 Tax=Thermofilum pendens TaxID=2269 RepID=A0A7C3WPK4_THEPE
MDVSALSSLLPRVHAAAASYLAFTLACTLLGLEHKLSVLLAILSAASPQLSSLFLSAMIAVSAYSGGQSALLAVLAPLLLLIPLKGLQGWHTSLGVLLASLLTITGEKFSPIFLGVLYAITSSEEPRRATLSGIVFASTLFLFAALALPAPAWVGGLVKVPGGLKGALSSTPLELVNAGQVYLMLLEETARSRSLALSFALLVISSLTASFLSEEVGAARSAVISTLLLAAVPLSSTEEVAPSVWLTGLLVAVMTSGAASTLSSVRLRRIRLPAAARSIPGTTQLQSQILFRDLLPLVSHIRETCRIGGHRYLVFLGLSLEDEKRFSELAVGRRCAAKVMLFHSLTPEKALSLEPREVLVVYIPPLTVEEAVRTLSEISGYPVEVIESVEWETLSILKYLDRSSLARVATLADSLIAKGYPAKRAFETAISSATPSYTPELALLIDSMLSRYMVLGLRNG